MESSSRTPDPAITQLLADVDLHCRLGQADAWRLVLPIREEMERRLAARFRGKLHHADTWDLIQNVLTSVARSLGNKTGRDVIEANQNLLNGIRLLILRSAWNEFLRIVKQQSGSSRQLVSLDGSDECNGDVAPLADRLALGQPHSAAVNEMLDSVELAFLRDSRCGTPESTERCLRALFFVLRVGLGFTPSDFKDSGEMHSQLTDPRIREELARLMGAAVLPWMDEHFELVVRSRWGSQVSDLKTSGENVLRDACGQPKRDSITKKRSGKFRRVDADSVHAGRKLSPSRSRAAG